MTDVSGGSPTIADALAERRQDAAFRDRLQTRLHEDAVILNRLKGVEMTWTAHVTVQDVSDGPAPIDVLAVANADEMYTIKGTNGGEDFPLPCIVSNTEGKIRSVEIRLVLDEDETALKPGDEIHVSGHFQGTQA